MKRAFREYVPAWLLLVILGLIVIHAPLTVFVGSHLPEYAVGVKAWKEILMVLAGLLIAWQYTITKRWGVLLRDKLAWLVLVFVGLHLAIAAFSGTGTVAIVAGLAIDLRYVAYFALVYAFLLAYPAYKPSFLKVGVFGACVVMGFALLQLFLPHDFLKYLGYSDQTIAPYMTVDKNPQFIRQNSTLRGPNPLGAYAVMVLAVVVAWLTINFAQLREKLGRQSALVIGLLLTGAVSLWVSYSRSALVAGMVAVAGVVLYQFRHLLTRKVWASIGVLLLLGVGVLAASWNTHFVQNVIVHDNPTTGAAIDSNEGHVTSLADGISRVARQPFGAGIGSTGSASLFSHEGLIIENQYLFIAHEAGWLGLGLFVAIFATVLARLWRRRGNYWALGLFMSGAGLALIGLLLPVWVDDTVAIVWWGLSAVIIATEGVRHGKPSYKKAKRTS